MATRTHPVVVVEDPARGRWYFDPTDSSQAREIIYPDCRWDGSYDAIFLVAGVWVAAQYHEANNGDGTWSGEYRDAVVISPADARSWCVRHGAELPPELAQLKPGRPEQSTCVQAHADVDQGDVVAISIRKAAARTGLSYDMIYDAVRAGELPAPKVGRVYRIKLADLDTWLESKKGGTSKVPPRSVLSRLVKKHLHANGV